MIPEHMMTDADRAHEAFMVELHRNPFDKLLAARRVVAFEEGRPLPQILTPAELEKFGLVPWRGRVLGMECEAVQ